LAALEPQAALFHVLAFHEGAVVTLHNRYSQEDPNNRHIKYFTQKQLISTPLSNLLHPSNYKKNKIGKWIHLLQNLQS